MEIPKTPRTANPSQRAVVGDRPVSRTASGEIDLLDVISILVERWKLVLGLPLAFALITAIVVLIIPERFAATASFVPQSPEGSAAVPGNLASLASQFGVAVPGGGEASPQFYADVLRSRTIRDQMLTSSFSSPQSPSGEPRPLAAILELEGENERHVMEEGREVLADITDVEVNSQTGVVSLTVETKAAELSSAMANRYLDLLNEFTLRMRTERAAERRAFLEGRLEDTERALVAAEERMREFLDANRDFSGAPHLTFEYQRLQRQLRIIEEVFTTLRRENEQIRIQELNTTETLAAIDRAIPPFEKSWPPRTLSVLAAGLVGGLIAMAVAFLQFYMERARLYNGAQVDSLRRSWQDLKLQFGRLVPGKR